MVDEAFLKKYGNKTIKKRIPLSQEIRKAIITLLQNPQVMTMYSTNALKTAEKINVEKVVCIWETVIGGIGEKKV